eukprot:Em0010g442a
MEQCAIRDCEKLIAELETISDASGDLKQRCKELESKAKLILQHIIGLHCTVQEHQQQIDELKRELEKAKIDHKRLYLAQVAYVFQQNICVFVLDKTIAEVSGYTLKALEYEINDPVYSPGPKVQERWDTLCQIYNWKSCWSSSRYDLPRDISAIKSLCDIRRDVAHPGNIDLNLAQDYLAELKHDHSLRHVGGLLEHLQKLKEKGFIKSGMAI